MGTNAFRYTGASFASNAITSFQDANVSQSADVTDFQADAQKFAAGVFVDNVVTRVTVTTADAAFAEEATYAPGTAGALKLTGKVRSGATDGPTITQDFAQAVLVGITANASHSGMGSVTLEFACYSSNGSTNPMAQGIA
jgi:hypothetical protein